MSGDDTIRRNTPNVQDQDDLNIAEDLNGQDDFLDDTSFTDDAEADFTGDDGFTSDEDVLDDESSDDWEAYDSEFVTDDAEEGEQPAKKKSSSNAIIIGGAIFAGLAVLLITVAGHKGATRVQTTNLEAAGQLPGVQAPPATTTPAPGTPAAKTANAPAGQDGGLLNDQNALNGLTNKIDQATANRAAQDASQGIPPNGPEASPDDASAVQPQAMPVPPMPAPVGLPPASAPASPAATPSTSPASGAAASGSDVLTPLPDTQASSASAHTPNPPPADTGKGAKSDAKEGHAMASNNPFMKADAAASAQPSPASAYAPVPAAPAGAAPSQADATATKALNDKLDQVLTRLSAVETKLATVQAQPSAAAHPTDASVQALQQSIDQLGSRLGKLEQAASANPAQKADSQNTAQSMPAQPVPVSSPETAPNWHPVKVKPIRNAESTHQATATHTSTRRSGRGDEQTAAHWVLKSAQPGRAYLSQPGQDDMISVRVGDILPGLGKVKEIGQQGDHWSVIGTLGSVSE